jgi:signal transduction histidine kinase
VKPEAPLLSSRTGLGLGLPIVQALAEANGAELRIESTPGSGTSASIVFRKERIVPV